MFVYSVKSSKLKIAVLAAAAIIVLGAVIFMASGSREPAAKDGAISLKAGNAQERTAFLSQFGWKIAEDPVEVTEVIIPAQFDASYTKYNDLQKQQGFDLAPYSSMRVKRWTYEVQNYPGYEGRKGVIQANLLVYDGKVIGGDICSVELRGFIGTFDFPQEITTAPPSEASTSALASTSAAPAQ